MTTQLLEFKVSTLENIYTCVQGGLQKNTTVSLFVKHVIKPRSPSRKEVLNKSCTFILWTIMHQYKA